MDINTNTTTWLDDLAFLVATKDKIEIPAEVLRELLDGYYAEPENTGGSVTVDCQECGAELIVEY